MTRDVETKRSLFGGEHLGGRPAFDCWRDLVGEVDLFRRRAEESVLTDQSLTLTALRTREPRIDATKQRSAPLVHCPAVLQRIERAGAHQTFKYSLIQSRRLNPLGEVKERTERSALPRLRNCF